MTPKELHELAYNPDADPESVRKALQFAVGQIADLTEVYISQETTGSPAILVRLGTGQRPQLTVTGPNPEMEDKICEMIAAYAYMQHIQIGDPKSSEAIAIRTSHRKGTNEAASLIFAAIMLVCPEQLPAIKAAALRVVNG